MVDHVRIRHGGDPLSGRVLMVSTRLDVFETPTRSPTSTELNARSRLHFDEPWDNPVFEIASRYNDRTPVTSLHRRNGTFANKKRGLSTMVERFKGYALVKYFPQVSHETHLSERDIRALVDLQIESGCDVISIPEPSANCTMDAFERNIQSWWEYVQRIDKDLAVIPYISLRQDHDLFESKLELKLEYITGNNVRGEKDRKQTTAVLTAGYTFIPSLQLMVKTYQAEAERIGFSDTKLGNTYIGFNWFLARVSEKHRDLQRHKVVLNYVIVNGDDVDASTPWNGLAGYRDSAYLLQWQYRY